MRFPRERQSASGVDWGQVLAAVRIISPEYLSSAEISVKYGWGDVQPMLRSCRHNPAGPKVLAFASLIFVLPNTGAWALSTGCAALNQSGSVLNNLPASDGFRTFGPFTGWEAGETLTLTMSNVTGSGTGISQFQTPGGSNTKFAIFGAGRGSYQLQAGDANLSLWIVVDSGRSNGDSANYTVTCSAPAANNQNIRSVQTSISTLVAITSGQVITSAIDSGIGDAFSSDGTPTNLGANGGFINFAALASKSRTASRTEEAFAALGYAGAADKAPKFKEPLRDRRWSAWADVRGTGWKTNDSAGPGSDIKGSQFNLTAGVGYRLTPDVLIGGIVGYENFEYDVAALAGTLKGDGETIGGYVARRFGGSLRFDAALAWSNVSYSAAAGAVTGSFTGSRWLASAGVTGIQKLDAFIVEPSAKLYMLWERQTAWADSLGTAQDARNFSTGRTALGAKVTRPISTPGGWTLSPYVGLYGDWRFQSDSALPAGPPVTSIGTGWSARVTSGLSATALNGVTLALQGDLGGLGADYKIWSGSARAAVPF